MCPGEETTYLSYCQNSKDIRRVCSGNSQVTDLNEEIDEEDFVIAQGLNDDVLLELT